MSPSRPEPSRRASAGDMLGNDLKLAVRSLLRSPGFLVTSVLSLAVAIGASASAFSVLDAVRFRALPFKDGNRLVVISETAVSDAQAAQPAASKAATRGAPQCTTACDVGYETFANILRTYPFRSIDVVAGYTSGGKALNTGTGEPLLVFGGVASPNLFDLLGAKPVRGRGLTADDDKLGVPLVTVLSYDLWQTAFGGDPQILGKVVKLSDSHYTVVGIMPPGFKFEVRSQFWLPTVPTLDPSTKPSIKSLTVVGRLRENATIEQLQSELASIDPSTAKATKPGAPRTRLDAAPLRTRYATSTQSHDVVMAAIVGCVLLIACANLANLVLVRTLHQQREFAIRSALGAGVGRLARVLLAQQFVLVAVGAALGLLLARSALKLLASLTVLDSLKPPGMEYRIDVRVATFAIFLAVVIGALLSIVPARVVANSDVQRLLREGAPSATGGRWGSRAQRMFVVAQVASAVVLLVGAGLLVRTVSRISQVNLGFDAQHVVEVTPSFPHPWRVKEKYMPLSRQLTQSLKEIPGVQAAAIWTEVPIGVPGAPSIVLQGQAQPLGAGIAPTSASSVSDDFFTTMGIQVLRGRAFDGRDLEGSIPVAIVNEWAARRWWPGEDALGKTFRVDTAPGQGATMSVVGIARDSKPLGRNFLLEQDGPEVYVPFEQSPSAFPNFFVRTGGAAAPLLKPVRELSARLVPDRPVSSQWLAESAETQMRGVRMNAMQVLGFAVVGLLLALVGVYGVLAYAVGRRTREIGIRGALGASRFGIGALVVTDAAVLVVIGLVIGLPVAAMATRLIDGMLYGTRATDPVVYGLVSLAVLAVALVASWIPARRASRVDPIVALRTM